MDLGDAIDGAWPLHAQIGGRVPGGRRAEGANSARHKQAQAVSGGYVENVVDAYRGRDSTLTSQNHQVLIGLCQVVAVSVCVFCGCTSNVDLSG